MRSCAALPSFLLKIVNPPITTDTGCCCQLPSFCCGLTLPPVKWAADNNYTLGPSVAGIAAYAAAGWDWLLRHPCSGVFSGGTKATPYKGMHSKTYLLRLVGRQDYFTI